jgi:L-seryl-tRNA(Ser) seleniumtransferase
MLDELHDRVGQRIATLVRAEAAMVTSGAASALTLGTAAILTGTDRQKIVDLPNLAGMKSEVIIQKAHRFGYDHAVRNCGVRLVEWRQRRAGARGQREDRDDALLQQQQQGRPDPGRGVRQAREEAGVPNSTTPPPTSRRWKPRSTPMGDLVAFRSKGRP